ncbi:HU family DNA-binding protein [Candidatus Williamhamiltonella defendens]|uniref:Integration host factor subunit beta n=1 Tax=Candidatus Hamiltonella defensa (Bemisia tabaci) TaxID=672795 RepID=A0A249E0B6_9ENTR|nr:HU family DNA-binding protein [Candidatus Hamiltonella defensa]ASX26780.1 integration host factor subunit beta [Candidatus Hamiltonella defensa (Bemisia tabaci)]CED79225.1 Integration host factor subunit beta [Candidatus Hamiltonella defensa (Bemisia tabaci)]
MKKSDFVERLVKRLDSRDPEMIQKIVKRILQYMSEKLSEGERIEIRGLGSFSLRHRSPRIARNPRTGDSDVKVKSKYVLHFKPGKKLRDRVNVYK